MLDIHIKKTGKYIPTTVVTNYDLEKIMDTNDEWIYTRTGIKQRTVGVNDTVVSMAVKAIEKMQLTETEKDTIDLIVVASMSHELITPSVSQLLQNELGLNTDIQCFDLNVACSGFVYALDIVHNFMKSGNIRNAIVVGADKMTNITDPNDRGTAILFADAASAAYIESRETPSILHRYFNTNGSINELICIDKLQMNGQEVFKFASHSVGNCITKIDEVIGIENIDYILLHQANQRITNNIIKKYKLEPSKVISNIENIGNTSSASIGLLLDDVYPQLKTGDKVVMIGFGAGLAYASLVYQH